MVFKPPGYIRGGQGGRGAVNSVAISANSRSLLGRTDKACGISRFLAGDVSAAAFQISPASTASHEGPTHPFPLSAVQVACHLVSGRWLGYARILGTANRHDMRAAGVKAAPGRRKQRVGDITP